MSEAPLENATPSRASGVVRDTELGGWVHCEVDGEGRRHGACRVVRDDGSLLLECRYEGGLRDGEFVQYHPDGSVACRGQHDGGKPTGTLIRYAADCPGAIPLRACCVPSGARELRLTFRESRCVKTCFFNEHGQALRANGALQPEPAATVPEDAEFDEASERWVLFSMQDDASLRRYFDSSGRLVEELEARKNHPTVRRTYRGEAELVEERRLDTRGKLTGEYCRRYSIADSPYLDGAIREERGEYRAGHPVGDWSFLDETGAVVRRIQRGEPLDGERWSQLSVEDPDAAELSWERVLARRDAGQLREALWYAARSTVQNGQPERWLEFMSSCAVPLGEQRQAAWRQLLETRSRVDVHVAMDAWIGGAEPALVCWALATLVPEGSSAAKDLIAASRLLDPTRQRTLATHAMIHLAHGDPDAALQDAARLEGDLREVATVIEDQCRLLFSASTFAAQQHEVPEPHPDLPEVGIEQPLEAIQRVVGLYAVRLQRARTRLIAELDGETPSWLPPDLSSLCSSTGASTELATFTTQIVDEAENAEEEAELSQVVVDETVGLDAPSIRQLLIVARADWGALGWLCWSVGLDEVQLPERLTPRAEFPSAVNDAMLRCWCAHDQIRTRGLSARARNIQGFSWEGFAIEELPRPLAEIAAAEYLERRAMFFWLLFPQNVSPFQDDLRQV